MVISGSFSYNLSLMKREERKNLFSDLYSKDCLCFRIGRLSIGNSDYPVEIYSYHETANVCHTNIRMKRTVEHSKELLHCSFCIRLV